MKPLIACAPANPLYCPPLGLGAILRAIAGFSGEKLYFRCSDFGERRRSRSKFISAPNSPPRNHLRK